MRLQTIFETVPELVKTCIHEAGHAVCGERLGTKIGHIIVSDDGSGDTKMYHPRGLPWIDRAAISYAGAAAEAYHNGDDRTWNYLSDGDRESIERYARAADISPRYMDVFEKSARRRAEAILYHPPTWRIVESVAQRLGRSNGRLIFETAKPDPAKIVPQTGVPAMPIRRNPPNDKLFRKALEMIWGPDGHYP